MSFDSFIGTGRLSEKPWTFNAIVRLGACILVCLMMGGAAAIVMRYFNAPQNTNLFLFVGVSAGAILSYVGTIVFLLRPWPREDYLARLLWILACMYGGLVFTWLASRLDTNKSELENPIGTMMIAVFCFQGAALVLVHFFLREHHTGWLEGFGFGNNPVYAVVLGVVVASFAVPGTWVLQILSSRLLESLTLHPQEQEAVQILRNTDDLRSRLMLGIATILIAPMGEEVLFRGILYPAIKRMGHPQVALWGTAILFGAIHVNLMTFVPLTLLAIALIWLYEHTGNLAACITTHSLFNAANFAALYLVQTNPPS